MRIAVVGPTATGKSDLALELAVRLGAEVVNADAMQLYRGMDIGTAKVPVAQRRGVPHHQLDVLDVTQDATVAAYQREARADLAAIAARGRPAVVVGGSGLYVRALLDRMDFPPTEAAVRRRWEQRAQAEGTAALHAELARLDPAAALAIPRANERRIVRALEVIELTGRPYTASLPSEEYQFPAVQIGLRLPVAALDERIARRVDRMWAAGLAEEVRELDRLGLRRGVTARRAAGYPETLAYLDGAYDAEQARQRIALATRRLARRQLKWFARDRRITWLDAEDPGLVDAAAEIVIRSG